ncbi:MAG: hypothetical protein WDZ88_00665 [Candidatus Paceibacterota bacterium]
MKKVLIVDEWDGVRKSIKMILQNCGYQCTAVPTNIDVDGFTNESYDLAIVGTGITGWSEIKTLPLIEKLLKMGMPVIGMSALPDHRSQMADVGALVIEKDLIRVIPFAIKQLEGADCDPLGLLLAKLRDRNKEQEQVPVLA